MAKRFEDMTEEEKLEAFQKYLATREQRKATSAVRRQATKNVIKAHQAEYDNEVKRLSAGKGKKE